MRLTINCRLSESTLPLDYRSGFISLFKKSLQLANSQLYSQYYESRGVIKPFTYSVYFPELMKNGKDRITTGHRALINFSTCSPELATHFYNGILNLKKEPPYPIFQNRLMIESVFIRPQIVIDDHECVFKTMAPVLVNIKDNKDQYLTPDMPGFSEGLRFAVSESAKRFIGRDGELQFENISTKRKVLTHYNASLSSFVGVFKIKGSRDLLQLIYDIGLGVRRSQGFGMLEVVKQG